jgi:hypothetical protein
MLILSRGRQKSKTLDVCWRAGAGVRAAYYRYRSVSHKFALLLLQFCVLRLGFFQDGDVGVGVLPEGEEVLIGSAGFRFVAGERVSAAPLACFRVGMSGSASFQRAEKSPPLDCRGLARESPDRGGIFPACFCPASEEACHPVPSLPRIPRDRNREALP